MVRLFNTRVYAIGESIVASGYPKRTEPMPEYEFNKESGWINDVVANFVFNSKTQPEESWWYTNEHFKRAMGLGKAKPNSGHDCYLKGIIVQTDITYPQYFTPQLQRYHFLDIVSSMSKMHRLIEMGVDNLDIREQQKEYLSTLLAEFKNLPDDVDSFPQFENILKRIPLGFELTMRITTNYLQLKTIQNQRKGHKLRNDWGEYIKWVDKLPCFLLLTRREKK